MAVKVIKEGIDVSIKQSIDSKVRETVRETLERIETGGDAAVRELSEKFDRYSPQSFRLSFGRD